MSASPQRRLRTASAAFMIMSLGSVAACASGSAPSATPSATLGSGGWSRHDLGPAGPRITALVAGPERFFGVGASMPRDASGSGIWSSADGRDWTAVDAPRADRSLVDLAEHGSVAVAVSSSPAGVWMSEPEGQWTQVAEASTFDHALLSSIASDGETLVVAGPGSAAGPRNLWTSVDGRSWTRANAPIDDANVHDVVAGGPGFVAVGSKYVGSMEAEARIWTSTDGREWTAIQTGPDFAKSELRAVAAADGRLVATGWTTDPERGLFFTPSAWTSADGTSWTRAAVVDEHLPDVGSVGALEGALMMAVSRASGGWIAAGTAVDARDRQAAVDAAVWLSGPDGSTWTRVAHEPRFEGGLSGSLDFGALSVAARGDRIVVVGRTQGPQTTVWIDPAQPGPSDPSPRPSEPPVTVAPSGELNATPAPPVPAPPSDPSSSVEPASYGEYRLATCAAWESLLRAVGNPETGEGSDLSRALDETVEARDGPAANDLAAQIVDEIRVGREHLSTARAWQPGTRVVHHTDKMFAAFEVMTEAKRAAANGEPGASNPQAALERAGGIDAWYALFEAMEDTRAAAGASGEPCPNVPLTP